MSAPSVSPAPFLPLLGLPLLLAAQTPGRSSERAVRSITAVDIRARIGVLAADSMRGRDTPSPELEKAATWIAEEFRRFGLRPAGDSGTYIQRYAIQRTQIDTAATFLVVRRDGRGATTLRSTEDVAVLRLGRPLPSRDVTGPIVVLTGPPDPADPLAGADVRGAWVAVLAPRGGLDARAATTALAGGAVGVLIISDRSGPEWRAVLGSANQPTVVIGTERPQREPAPAFAEVRERTASRSLGIDVATLRAARRHGALRLRDLTLALRVRERVVERASAPNVIGLLEGSEPRLSSEYVLFTAHMDHIGVAGPANAACRAQGGDSICNGADDDASGTAAVLSAARAFSQLEPRPRRSLVFMTVSGEEKGLWGSEYFGEHPTVPLRAVVADLNTDMVGRNWRDTIAVIGKEQSDLGATLDRVAAAHPELDMTPVGDRWPAEHFYERSDHYNFARRGIPILFFFNGTHVDYHAVTDEAAKIDAEKEARVVKLLFYLGLEVADAAARPRWDPRSYRRVVDDAN